MRFALLTAMAMVVALDARGAAPSRVVVLPFTVELGPEVLAQRLPELYAAAIVTAGCGSALASTKLEPDAAFAVQGRVVHRENVYTITLSVLDLRTGHPAGEVEHLSPGSLAGIRGAIRKQIGSLCLAIDPAWKALAVPSIADDLAFDDGTDVKPAKLEIVVADPPRPLPPPPSAPPLHPAPELASTPPVRLPVPIPPPVVHPAQIPSASTTPPRPAAPTTPRGADPVLAFDHRPGPGEIGICPVTRATVTVTLNTPVVLFHRQWFALSSAEAEAAFAPHPVDFLTQAPTPPPAPVPGEAAPAAPGTLDATRASLAFDHAPRPGETALCPVSGDVFVVTAATKTVRFEGRWYAFVDADSAAAFEQDPRGFTKLFVGR